MALTFHIIGDSYADIFSFLDGDWPEHGGDSRLSQPVKSFAGGSSTNTATHLQSLHHDAQVVWHTVLNPNDHYGKLLMRHAEKHGFPLVNCRRDDDTSWTGHCIAIVSGEERTFMTHQGCVENFTAEMLNVEQMVATNGPIHVHVAGYFNVTGFWNGNLKQQLIRIRNERARRFPNQSTTISLVTQHDASKQWDGGLDDLIPYLDFLIMNELEASRILRRGRGKDTFIPRNDEVTEWISFFSPLNPNACIIVTRGKDGAVAFRNGELIATISPAVQVGVVDPTGAGDSFTAGFLYGIWRAKETTRAENNGQIMWSSQTVKEGLQWGCAVGTAAVTIRGASNPSKIETILELYEQQKAKDL